MMMLDEINLQVEEGEEMDISCTATDGNPLPKVITSLSSFITTTLSIITSIIIMMHHHHHNHILHSLGRHSTSRGCFYHRLSSNNNIINIINNIIVIFYHFHQNHYPGQPQPGWNRVGLVESELHNKHCCRRASS